MLKHDKLKNKQLADDPASQDGIGECPQCGDVVETRPDAHIGGFWTAFRCPACGVHRKSESGLVEPVVSLCPLCGVYGTEKPDGSRIGCNCPP